MGYASSRRSPRHLDHLLSALPELTSLPRTPVAYYGGGQRGWLDRALTCTNAKLASPNLAAPVIRRNSSTTAWHTTRPHAEVGGSEPRRPLAAPAVGSSARFPLGDRRYTRAGGSCSRRQRTSPVQDTTERDGDQTMPGTALWDALQGCDRATPRAMWWKPYPSMANRLEWFPLDFIITTALSHAGPLDDSFRVGYLWVQ